jgi:tetratricopeptide (TPR) repeat protein/predicted Ser/Thr protein kinase
MVCPHCRTPNPDGTQICVECRTPIEVGDATEIFTGHRTAATGWSDPSTWSSEGAAEFKPFEAGAVLADRYEIVRLLGEGGMGAVYRARDRELDREVALKVIRPELARNAQVLGRFKQELILARQVTHRNIIRIFDLGSDRGTRFITMEFIEGEDLSSILARRGKLPVQEAAAIIRQACLGLEVAHAEGVVHRDLKPQNIMLDQQGKVSVMDFGIARSIDESNLTRTGALLGTPTYMSPEQAQGHKVDARSDLYTLGIIFYELVTGTPPFSADSPMATLVRRIQEKPAPPVSLEPSLPPAVNAIILKMLATNAADRYQNAGEILRDLDAWEGRPGSTWQGVVAKGRGWADDLTAKIALAAVVVLAAATGWLYFQKPGAAPPAPSHTVTVLVADFRNNTGEPVFDGTLEPAIMLALEGAPFISAYSRGDARAAAEQLRPGAAVLDENLARLVAARQGVEVVVARGEISRQGSGYRIRVSAENAIDGKDLVTSDTQASGKQDVLAAAAKLAVPIRRALGDVTPEAAQLRAAETYSAGSLEAAQHYARGQALQWLGQKENAIQEYLAAVAADPNMGRAYSGLAVTYSNLGQRLEAEKYFEQALAKMDRMTDRERFRTRGAYYLFQRNYDQAIKELSALTQKFPADDAGRTNLALAYFYRRDIARAIQENGQAIQIYKHNLFYRNNQSLYEMYAGQFNAALAEAAGVLQQNPQFVSAYVPIALSNLALGKVREAEAAYRGMEAVNAHGKSLAALGLADLALYEGRVGDATALLEHGIDSDLKEGLKAAAAVKLAALAGAARSQPLSIEAASRALDLDPSPAVSFTAARALTAAGQDGRADAVARRLAASLEPEPQAYAKLLEGEAQLARHSPREAIRLFQDAEKLVDMWLAHFDLMRAYIELGAFTEASSESDICVRRGGEATAVFFDDLPSYRYFPAVYYYTGRVQEGLKSGGAAQSYQKFLAIKAQADPGDPIVMDARQRNKALSQ